MLTLFFILRIVQFIHLALLLSNFYIEDITSNQTKKISNLFCCSKNIIYICHAQGALKPQAGQKVKRESGVNPEQFLLLCISTLYQSLVYCILCHWL